MGLSDSVDALLDAYSRCISLLKVFGSSNAAGSSRSVVVPGPTSSDLTRQSDLSRSLQNDRARIKKAYLDRLSETGSQLQKGDGASRSALRRIARRLTDALARILGAGHSSGNRDSAMPDGRPLLNYDALRALSNASRADAIHAIDEASVRLRSHSSVSGRSRSSRVSQPVGHSGSASSSGMPSRAKKGQSTDKKRRTTGSSSAKSHGPSSSHDRNSSKTAANSRSSSAKPKKVKKRTSSPSREMPKQPKRVHKQNRFGHARDSSSSTHSNSGTGSGTTVMARPRLSAAAGHLGRRVSVMSSSTASTKLGEIPVHKLQRRQEPATNGDNPWAAAAPGYNIRPAYPMRPLRVSDAESAGDQKPKKRFWGVFGR